MLLPIINNKKSEIMKNNLFIVPIALLAILLSANTVQAQVKKITRSSTTRTETSNGNSYLNVDYDSANGTEHITLYKNGEVYKIKVVNDKVTEIIIDDKKIPEADFSKYEPMIKKIREQIKEDQEQAVRDRAQAELDRKQAERDRQQADEDRKQAEEDRKQADKDRGQAELDRQQAEKDRQQSVKDRAQAEQDKKQAEKDRAQAELDRQQAVKDRAQAERDRAQAVIDRKHAEEDRKMLAGLIDDLIKENVVKSKDDLHVVQLSDESLIVNDKKQPDALHQQLKAKYLKKPGTRFTFTNHANRSGFSIERDN
jgi:hypothetical protein